MALAPAAIAPIPNTADTTDTKRRFGIFKRRNTSKVHTDLSAPLLQEENIKSEYRSLKEVLTKEEKPPIYGSAINLKEMRKREPAVVEPLSAQVHEPLVEKAKAEVRGHIIALKKPL